MSNPTSNFGWQMPTPTDLVTDLPADFEVFGQAVDSSMADLKGGTTGQILSKATNTDMDFVWITNDQGDITAVTAGTGISGGGTSGAVTVTNSMATTMTTKGDLVPATGSGTFARLAVGSNGETLVADSSTSTGLRYTAGNPISNPVINSCFDIWQRGTSVATGAAAAYTADRWYALRDSFAAGLTVSRQATNDTTNLPFIQYCARVQRDSGNTGTQLVWFSNNFETSNSVPFAGKTVTLSFYARAGANYSSASSALGVRLYSGTGTDQNIVSGYTGQALPIDTTVTLTTTWQRFSITTAAAVASTATELAIRLAFTPSGTAGAADFFETTGVQIDIGSVALPVRRNGATIQGETSACQRYYTRINATQAYFRWSTGMVLNSTNCQYIIPFKQSMRTTPTFAASGNFEHLEGSATRSTSAPTLSVDGNGSDSATINGALTGANAAYAIQLRSGNSTASYLEFSAEL